MFFKKPAQQRKNFSDAILSLKTGVSQRLVMLHYSRNILCVCTTPTEGSLLFADSVPSEGFIHYKHFAVSPLFHKFGLTLAAGGFFFKCVRVTMKEELDFTFTCQVHAFCVCVSFIRCLILRDSPSECCLTASFFLHASLVLLFCTLKLSKLYRERCTSSLP